jgi:serine/threonine protein kinase
MSTARMCNGCRQPLPENAPEGLCPACLAKAALSGSASASGAPIDVTPPAEAATGTTLKISEAQLLAGGDNSPGHALETGRPFGGYHILRCLGKGGMGAVYEVEEIETGRRLALKVLTHALDSPQARQRFLREGRLAASINHPNSVYVFGTEEIDGLPVITMELVAGGTLQDRVKQRGPLPVAAAVDAVLQVVAGLEAAAKAGVLHRDVKPSNCFIELDGAIKVGDFGLSITTLRQETKLTMTGSVLGTPAYASPEQLRGDDMTVR